MQYKSFLVGLLKLDLGFSLRTRQPVLEELSHRFFATFELVFVSMFVAVLFGFLLGLFSATQQGSSFDRLVRGVGYLGLSFPLFWLGMILKLIFFGLLKWLPLQGRRSGFAEADITIEREFETGTYHQGYIESHNGTAQWNENGEVWL